MAPKRSNSKDTTERSTREEVKSSLVNFPINSDNQLFIEKESYITWQKVNEVFTSKSFKADLEDQHLYINVQWSRLHKIA